MHDAIEHIGEYQKFLSGREKVARSLDAGRESVTPSNRYNDNGPHSLARLGNLAKAKYRHTHACMTHRY